MRDCPTAHSTVPTPSPSVPQTAIRRLLLALLLLGGGALGLVALAGIVVMLAYPLLPSLEVLTDYRPKIPLRVYSSDGYLMGEFGEERRDFVRIEAVPAVMKQAILAAEDERFYTHPGVDTLGVLRAAYSNFASGGKRQGASTITMQVARNFFLSSEKTLTRKLYEALLALKIEHSLSKNEIFQLYINQIYLGQRAYGFSSAAQIYFGKPLKDITLAEAAMLAGLPKAPSSYNPVANPRRAQLRQHYVLRRMRELDFINDAQLKAAQEETLHVKRDANDFGIHADYVAEMARQIAAERFPDDLYSRGYRVITTITRDDQQAAWQSLRRGVLDYDRRHGYRGAEAYVDLADTPPGQDDAMEELLGDIEDSGDLLPAITLEATPQQVRVWLRSGEILNISGDGLKFAAAMLSDKAPPNKRIRRGAVIRVQKADKGWQIVQLPEVQAAFVAASPVDGAIRALVGGFDFNRSKFNHVTQAWRQPGSSFKPFIYSAALEKGYTPASVIPDEPIVISAEETGSQAWEPKNYDGKYEGPMSLRTALAKSKNMVSIRLLRAIGPHYAQDYATRFGFDADKQPPYLTLALGAGSVTPWQQLTAYSVFANGGYRIEPYIVRQILDDKNNVLAATQPAVAGDESLRVIDARNAWLMDSMMHDVVRRGTATRAAAVLKRGDLAGKTGTTNDYIDAWFCGYQPTVVGIAWIGFDQPKRMGSGETGGAAALPIWIGFMAQALKGVPQSFMEIPEGLVAVTTSDPTGNVSKEFVYKEHLPPVPTESTEPEPQQAPAPVEDAKPKVVEKAAPPNPAKPGGDKPAGNIKD
ncbi:MAG: penicillin-binding protein 1A [Rhodocyclales bacterium]|nr:penicillin-binding protein 1A [Rhodocyclales bacterium]